MTAGRFDPDIAARARPTHSIVIPSTTPMRGVFFRVDMAAREGARDMRRFSVPLYSLSLSTNSTRGCEAGHGLSAAGRPAGGGDLGVRGRACAPRCCVQAVAPVPRLRKPHRLIIHADAHEQVFGVAANEQAVI